MKKLEEMSLAELWALFPIQLCPYDPQYPQWYQQQKRSLEAIFPERRRIHHIGSTAVPGLLSKPIVDILLETDTPGSEICRRLACAGWRCMSRQEQPELRLSFNLGYLETGWAERVYHLHIRRGGDWDELYFRDYLLANQEAAAAYGRWKASLLPQYTHDRDGYTAAKTEIVARYTALGRQMFEGRYLPEHFEKEQ